MLENAYLQVRRQIEGELLAQIKSAPPEFLERVVVVLVVRMGYGGSRKDAGEALGNANCAFALLAAKTRTNGRMAKRDMIVDG